MFFAMLCSIEWSQPVRKHPKIERIDEQVLSTFSRYTPPQILANQAERFGSGRIAIREKEYGVWSEYSWQEYFDRTKQAALGLIKIGLKRGDHLAIITDNHPEWLFSELGTQAVGAVPMNMYTSSVSKEFVYGLSRIQAPCVVAQDQEQVDKLLEVRDEIPFVRRVIYIDPTAMDTYMDDPWLLSFAELLDLGKKLEKKEPDLFMQELWKGKSDEIAVLSATSGTTGLPKVAMLTHLNFTEMARKWLETVPIGIGDNYISILPPAWIVDQMWAVGITLLGGMTINFPETPETAVEDFREIGPSIIIAASHFWEGLASKIRVKMEDSAFIKRKVYYYSQTVGAAVTELEFQKKPIPLHLQLLNWFTSKIVFRPLMDRVGCSQFRTAFTGGHPISPDVIRFFRANGLNLKQCYGMTETTGIFQLQPDGEFKFETVGKSLPGVEIEIAEDEEVLVRSGINFIGYYENPDATAKALADGWFHTGDAGYLDDDGHLIIIGRKEEIVRTASGEAYSPDFIETRLKFSPYIKEVVVFGEGRPYLTAMINIDMGNVGNWAENRKIPYTTYTDLSQQSPVEDLICGEVRQVNAQLKDAMKIRKIFLLYKLLDADDEELTRTGKVRRKFVFGQYQDLIEAMYEGKNDVQVKGQVLYRDGQVGTIETNVKILTV